MMLPTIFVLSRARHHKRTSFLNALCSALANQLACVSPCNMNICAHRVVEPFRALWPGKKPALCNTSRIIRAGSVKIARRGLPRSQRHSPARRPQWNGSQNIVLLRKQQHCLATLGATCVVREHRGCSSLVVASGCCRWGPSLILSGDCGDWGHFDAM